MMAPVFKKGKSLNRERKKEEKNSRTSTAKAETFRSKCLAVASLAIWHVFSFGHRCGIDGLSTSSTPWKKQKKQKKNKMSPENMLLMDESNC